MLFYVGSAILMVLATYCWLEIKRTYGSGRILPLHVSTAIWILDTFHFVLVGLASLYSVWQLEFSSTVALIVGLIMIVAGLALLLSGMVAFRSLRRISGMESSVLMMKGIYRWSRNPQYTGWFICLLGVSLMGRSALAFLFTLVLVIGIHLYNIWLEEPYLEHVLGEDYRKYKSRTARYIGIPKKRENSNREVG